MTRKLIVSVICMLVLVNIVYPASVLAVTSGLTIDAVSAVLYEPVSGRFLYAHEPDLSLAPASLVKIMTMFVAYEALENREVTLETEILVSEKAWLTTGSRMFIREGERVPISELKRGIAVVSGNDACVALAEGISGSEQLFVDRMNASAQRLGASSTVFKNSHGLDVDGQVTTAHDIAIISAALLERFPQAIHELSLKEYTYADITQPNRNRLLWTDARVNGLKTGYTQNAGYSIAVSAQTDDLFLIAVVMGTDSEQTREREAARLLDWGFANFVTVTPLREGERVGEVRVWQGRTGEVEALSLSSQPVTIDIADRSSVSVDFQPALHVRAPVARGDKIGDITIKVGSRTLGTIAAVAADDVPRGNLFRRIIDAIWLFFITRRT